MSLKILTLAISIFAGANPLYSQDKAVRSLGCEEKVQRLIPTLPRHGMLRRALEIGHRGEGVRQPWMDIMKQYGVKHANATIRYEWDKGIRTLKIVETRYFREYEDGNGRIRNPRELGRLRDESFDAQMHESFEVRAQMLLAVYMRAEGARRAYGKLYINLLDDECLPVLDPLPQICPDDKTPLMRAVINGRKLPSNEVLMAGVDVEPCVELLAPSSEMESVEKLIASAVDVDAKDYRGRTALMFAAMFGNTESLKALLAAGADVNARTKHGETALSLAVRANHKDVVDMLKKAGAEE